MANGDYDLLEVNNSPMFELTIRRVNALTMIVADLVGFAGANFSDMLKNAEKEVDRQEADRRYHGR